MQYTKNFIFLFKWAIILLNITAKMEIIIETVITTKKKFFISMANTGSHKNKKITVIVFRSKPNITRKVADAKFSFTVNKVCGSSRCDG